MIDSPTLLATLQRQLNALLDDLRTRIDTERTISEPLRAEYQHAFDAERTAWTFTDWAEDRLTQVAVGWLLACVFVRFGEDNHLIDDAMIAGGGARGAEARAAQQDFFRANPHGSDRDYLHDVFRAAAALPGLEGLLGEGHSPLWLVDPSADACTDLLVLFRRADDSGALAIEFTDTELDTRFLGDIYQDLSEHAKKTYALLQTPIFVEEFILDRTLEPAIETHGLANTSLIDPTCGSGHFLLGAFDRLWQRWADAQPGESAPVTAQRALDAIWGVDLNPFAAAIARFRLLLAALKRCHITRLADAPDFTIHVAIGDSLLWGAPQQLLPGMEGPERVHLYATEDADTLTETFGRRYAAVVGNPPYIVPKDPAANAAYRAHYGSCHRQYSLGVPFTELFFNLAAPLDPITGSPAGHVGMITANSFMKREFGKKLIEQHIPRWDLTHVVDTSGASIPGHGTPTVILFGRNQSPVSESIRTVLGIRGEPSTPPDPSKGLVWSAIEDQIDLPGSESDFVSVADMDRARFAKHPWSIGGGGASELKQALDDRAGAILRTAIDTIGSLVYTRCDEAFLTPTGTLNRMGLAATAVRLLGEGQSVRDYAVESNTEILFPYDADLVAACDRAIERRLWPFYQDLIARREISGSQLEIGLKWFEYNRFLRDRYRVPLSIAFASVATHNHFVLDRGGKVFSQSAPVIKLPAGATADDHFGLLGLLNSSVAGFWARQQFQDKGNRGEGGGICAEAWERFHNLDGTKMLQFPLPVGEHPSALGRRLDELAADLAARSPSVQARTSVPNRDRLDVARAEAEHVLAEMVAWQEELDWHCLHLYGLIAEPLSAGDLEPPPLALGERAFEILLARRVAAGDVETAWFTRHGSQPLTEVPSHWPDWYRGLVERRIELIETDRNVGLVERPEHKRRWNRIPWDERESVALRAWLLDRLEERSLWFDGDRATVRTVAQLADRVSSNDDWMSVARTWKGQVEVDPVSVVSELVSDEHVPAQATVRYKASGLKKRAEWERTWGLQRAEDCGENVGRIAVPPKYAQGDFAKTSYWRQRGKLDVPKERFTSVHSAERDASAGDSSMVLAWAGFDHAQLAQALATLLYQRQTVDGWTGERLVPLIAALDELLPWVEQWHPEVDPGLGQPLATFYRGQVDQALASIGATRMTLAEWRPPAPTRGRKRAASSDVLIES